MRLGSQSHNPPSATRCSLGMIAFFRISVYSFCLSGIVSCPRALAPTPLPPPPRLSAVPLPPEAEEDKGGVPFTHVLEKKQNREMSKIEPS